MMKKQEKKTWELTRHAKRWTAKEENLLKQLYSGMFNFELVEHFERTSDAICRKAGQLRLKKNWRKYPNQIRNCKLWSKKEIKQLRKLYPITSTKALQALFGRTKSSIYAQASLLGVHKACYIPGTRTGEDSRLWTKEEDALIKKLYPTGWTNELAAQLDRSVKAILHRATHLGVQKDPEKFTPPPTSRTWSDSDRETLQRLWQQGHTIPHIAKALSKTKTSVASQINLHRQDWELQKRLEIRPWSKEEDAYILRYYRKKPSEEIVAALGRTTSAVRNRAMFLKTTKHDLWTAEEIKKLRQLWQNGCTKTEIAEILDKPWTTVQGQINLHIRAGKLQKRWELELWHKEETDYLIKHYKNTSTRQISVALGKKISSIWNKAKKLKLAKRAEKIETACERKEK